MLRSGLVGCFQAHDARFFQISVSLQPGNSGGALVVASKLKDPNTSDMQSAEVVEKAKAAAVLVLVY
jgi:hypothetical protein